MASGGTGGIVTVWEIETGKINSHFQLEDCDITSIQFCEPYPIILTANTVKENNKIKILHLIIHN